MGYDELYDRYIHIGRFEEGGIGQNMALIAINADFETGDGHSGECYAWDVNNTEQQYSIDLKAELGGDENLGVTWATNNAFFNTNRMTIHDGKVYFFSNVLRVVDSNFGFDMSTNDAKLRINNT